MKIVVAVFLILSTVCINAAESCPGGKCDGIYLVPNLNFTALHKEKDYQNASCRGEIEHVLPDKTRVDCLTDTHAIEFDFGAKWAEAVGQSLYYSFQTGKKAGIVLIFKKDSDMKYYHRLMSVIQDNSLKIDVWIIRPQSALD